MTDMEIVKALRCCTVLTSKYRCEDCPAEPIKTGKRGCGYVSLEAAAAIERLTRERDAAHLDIEMVLHGAKLICGMCDLKDDCKNYGNEEPCDSRCDEAKWRGPCAENGGNNEA